VTQRTYEIGVRMALGAQVSDVLTLIVGHGIKLDSAGVAGGLVAALLMTRLLATLLYNVSATDSTTFVVVSVVLAGVALVACFVSAACATQGGPIVRLS